MVRATRVAVATASNSGTMNDRSRPVSSIIDTTVEIWPYAVAARTAAAPSTANNPGGTPGQNQDHACPSTAPSNAPAVREGVNKLRDVLAVAQQLRERDRNRAKQPQSQQRRREPSPTLRFIAIGPGVATHQHARRRPTGWRRDGQAWKVTGTPALE